MPAYLHTIQFGCALCTVFFRVSARVGLCFMSVLMLLHLFSAAPEITRGHKYGKYFSAPTTASGHGAKNIERGHSEDVRGRKRRPGKDADRPITHTAPTPLHGFCTSNFLHIIMLLVDGADGRPRNVSDSISGRRPGGR